MLVKALHSDEEFYRYVSFAQDVYKETLTG